MKFLVRFLILTNVVTLSALFLFYHKFVYQKHGEESGYGSKAVLGIQVDPWRVRSLQGIGESDRVRFAKIYDDNRRIFGDGKEQQEPLTKNTKPFEFPALRGARAVLSDAKVKKLVSEQVVSSDPMRNLGNLQKLFFAADEIRRHRHIKSKDFRSVLQLRTRMISKVPEIKKYGESFALSQLEKSTLEKVNPQQRKEAKRNNRNKKRRSNFIGLRLPKNQKNRHKPTGGLLPFYSDISRYEMYTEGDTINGAISDLTRLSVINFDITTKHREFSAVLKLKGSYQAIMTPGKYSRTQETIPNHHHMDEDNRHTSEIAAFHLDRVLGFRRALPCVGRTFNITKDLVDHQHRKYNEPFISMQGNVCLKSHCSHCGDKVCGAPDIIEASITPALSDYNVTKWPYPWRQTDELNDVTSWEIDTSFCDDIRLVPPYNKGRRLLDIIDLAIFDFLQGNLRRKEYQTFKQFGQETFIHHINNSRGFGKSYRDDITILAPLYQCCNIRFSTFHTLLDFELGPSRLSDVMKASLSRDPIAPVLLDQHLLALDRRLRITLKMVYECISLNGAAKVVILDGF